MEYNKIDQVWKQIVANMSHWDKYIAEFSLNQGKKNFSAADLMFL